MSFLNYHHLRYFREIANQGNLTRAAEALSVSPAALSVQLKQLEAMVEHPLFDRVHKKLVLTEAGRIALDYAESIFRSGEEMLDRLQNRPTNRRQILRIGAVSTLSRNFQLERIRPFLNRSDVELILHTGLLRDLLPQLNSHTIDVILSNRAVARDSQQPWYCHLLEELPVSLIGPARKSKKKFQYPQDLRETPILLPGCESQMRTAFDLEMKQAGIHPMIAAEVDDMTMLRLLARNSQAVTLVPPVVVQDELRQGILVEWARTPLRESFYAITPERRFPNPLVADLIRGPIQAKVLQRSKRIKK